MTAENPAPYSARFSPRHQLILIVLLLIGAALRFHALAAESLWLDEALSVLFASQSLRTSIDSMLSEGLHHSPLYYLLLRPFAADGFNEYSVRFLPALLGVMTIPLIAHLGRVVSGPRVGLLAAGLLAINPFHIWYSRETRMYTLLVLAVVAAMYFFLLIMAGRSSLRNWIGLIVATAIGINTHHFAFYVPLVQFAYLLVTFRQTYQVFRYWVLAEVLAGLSLIPWILIVLDWGQYYGASASPPVTPVPADWVKLVWNFSIGYTIDVTVPVVLTLGLVFALLGYALVRFSSAKLLLVLWFVLPPTLTLLISLRVPLYMDRYVMVSLPAFIVLLAAGITDIERRNLQRIAAAALVVAMLWGTYRVYYDDAVYERADWRAVSVYLADHADPNDDQIVTKNYQDLIAFHFYYHGDLTIEPVLKFDQANLPELPPEGSGRRFWLIIPHNNASTHLVGHCQDFAAEDLGDDVPIANWWRSIQARRVDVIQFNCIRLEVYE